MFFTFARMQCWGLPDAKAIRGNQWDRSRDSLFQSDHGPVPLIFPLIAVTRHVHLIAHCFPLLILKKE